MKLPRHLLLKLLLAAVVAGGLLLVYLDARITATFTDKMWELPAKVYANEGIAQLIFLKADRVCAVSYADKAGKYQDQVGLTLPKVD